MSNGIKAESFINRKLFVSSEMSVPVFAPAPAAIVTFDVGGPQTFINNQDVPGFEEIIKAVKFNAATIEQDATPSGKITTPLNADTAYFVGKKDLTTVNAGLPKVEGFFKATVIGSQLDIMITGSQLSVNAPLEPADEVVGITIISNGTILFRYRAAGGGALTNHAIFGAGTYTLGADVAWSIEKISTGWIFTFDGNTAPTLLDTATQTQAAWFWVGGELFSGTRGTLFFRLIKGLT